ncbi:pyridoxamine 5'-phosphate oxidase family protein [Streptomyces sp. NPDC047043]|uniref:pyridoxamine 5'-phosphate oxidase family protein n=1 Tax=Streptomyces sp. NPDC047043 TaxID=3154497 RepID=UPI0033C5558E
MIYSQSEKDFIHEMSKDNIVPYGSPLTHPGLLARLGTVGPSGQPMIHPLVAWFDLDSGLIWVGSFNLPKTQKARNIAAEPRVSVVVDDWQDKGSDVRGRGIEVRGVATLVPVEEPFSRGFSADALRIEPRRILSWYLEGPGHFARNVDVA